MVSGYFNRMARADVLIYRLPKKYTETAGEKLKKTWELAKK